jgi:hypothetical protein
MTHIAANFNFTSVSTDLQFPLLQPIDANPVGYDFLNDLKEFLNSLRTPIRSRGGCGGPGEVSPPIWQDRCHPSGGLKVDQSSGVITTPGGYKIEQVGQYEWKITGQDGKWTRFWGDPHIQESDRGGESSAWDFKRDSSFVLPDGTRINVTTKPYNNMTVTSQLEVINGNDRVMVTDIDKGKGKVGEVTHDGRQHADDFCGKDVFEMGSETDDWYFHGQEVLGSNNGGDSFKLGQSNSDDLNVFLSRLEEFGQRLMQSLINNWPTGTDAEDDTRRDRMANEIQDVNRLFRLISRWRSLNSDLSFGRASFQA